jgi:hypothetical protein
MRSSVLRGREQLTRMPLLELDRIHFAERGCHENHLLGSIEISSMIAADFSDDVCGSHDCTTGVPVPVLGL